MSEPIQMVRSENPLMTVSPMLEIKIVKDGTASRDHKTKNARPLLEIGEKSALAISDDRLCSMLIAYPRNR